MLELVLDKAMKNWFLHENLMELDYLIKYLKHLIIVVFVISND